MVLVWLARTLFNMPTETTAWKRWVRQPQSLLLRKALFQIHLWAGIGCGLYVLLISVSGSALVYRRELAKTFSREPVVVASAGRPLTLDRLKQSASAAYPGYEIVQV